MLGAQIKCYIIQLLDADWVSADHRVCDSICSSETYYSFSTIRSNGYKSGKNFKFERHFLSGLLRIVLTEYSICTVLYRAIIIKNVSYKTLMELFFHFDPIFALCSTGYT